MTHNEDFPPSKNALNGASELLQRLKMDVFRHSLRKFVARVDKRYNAFHEFSGRLKDYWLQQSEIDKDAQNTFETAAMGIRIIKRLVSRGMEDIGLDSLLIAVNALQPPVRALVRSPCLFSWCSGVAESESLPLRL